MKRIIVKDPEERERYPDDVTELVRILATNGYDASRDQAERMWQLYSEAMCAGWMLLDSTDEATMNRMRPFFDETMPE